MDRATLVRMAKVIALLGFFLPWAAISCAGQPFASMSGVDMALGNVHFSVGGRSGIRNTGLNPFFCAALLVTVVGAIASFTARGKQIARVALVTSLIALAATVGGMTIFKDTERVRREAAILAQAEKQTSSMDRFASDIAASVVETMRVDERPGYWITVIALLGAAVVGASILAGRGEGEEQEDNTAFPGPRDAPWTAYMSQPLGDAPEAPSRIGLTLAWAGVVALALGGIWFLYSQYKTQPASFGYNASEQSQQASSPTSLSPVAVEIGDGVNFGKYTVSIKRVDQTAWIGIRENVPMPDSMKLALSLGAIEGGAGEGGTLIMVDYNVLNSSTAPLAASDRPHIQLRDQNGTLLEMDEGKTAMVPSSEKLVSNLNPGMSERKAVVFEVSKAQFNPHTWTVVIDGNAYVKLSSMATAAGSSDSLAPVDSGAAAEAAPTSDEPAVTTESPPSIVSQTAVDPGASEQVGLPKLLVGTLRGDELKKSGSLFGMKGGQAVPLYEGDRSSVISGICFISKTIDGASGYYFIENGHQRLMNIEGQTVSLDRISTSKEVFKYADRAGIYGVTISPTPEGSIGGNAFTISQDASITVTKQGMASAYIVAKRHCGR